MKDGSAIELAPINTCICCTVCAHPVVFEGQYAPCTSCGNPVSHSTPPRAEDVNAYRIARAAKPKAKAKPKKV
jgi:hypothetical protein